MGLITDGNNVITLDGRWGSIRGSQYGWAVRPSKATARFVSNAAIGTLLALSLDPGDREGVNEVFPASIGSSAAFVRLYCAALPVKRTTLISKMRRMRMETGGDLQ